MYARKKDLLDGVLECRLSSRPRGGLRSTSDCITASGERREGE
jgi:hypothetical protein